MKNYSITLSETIINTKIDVYELNKDGQNLLELFYEENKEDKIFIKNIASVLRIVEDTSNLLRKPKKKFRLILGHKLKCKVYEAKSDSVRLYLFHEEKTGRVIVSGGFKGTQKKDIKKVIKVIEDYYDEK